MTTKEYIQKEAEAAANEMFPIGNEHETKMIARQEHKNGIYYGLTKGLELAKEFAEWIDERYTQEKDGIWVEISLYDGISKYKTSELLEIFITEKENNHDKG